jgi:KDO2-lipid IV(A) lauroyltransferase
MKYRFKHIVEYVFIRQLVVLLRSLPYRAALCIGWLLAATGFHLVKFRVAEAERRIREVFPGRFTNREVRRIAWISWRNFVFCVVDMIRLPGVSEAWARKHVVNYDEVTERVRNVFGNAGGAVLVCPHTGSWELAGVIMQILNVPIFFITGRQKNPLVDRYLNKLRGSTGIETVQRGSSLLKSVIRRLKSGGVLAFLPDVRAGTEEILVDFLGSKANVPAGMALFARQAGVPIITGISSRVGWSRHKLKSFDPVVPDRSLEKQDDWARMTQQVFSYIEEFVRSEPEQWFWFNKRWILEPLEKEQEPETGVSPAEES